MSLCPNCRHEAARHSASHECGEPGCSCLCDPKGSAAFVKTNGLLELPSVPLTPPPSRGALVVELGRRHPYVSLVVLAFVMMGLTFCIEAAEDWVPAAAWMARHGSATAWIKNTILLLAVPGIFILTVWVPGSDSRDMNKPMPRWGLAALIAGFVAVLLYGAACIYLAGR